MKNKKKIRKQNELKIKLKVKYDYSTTMVSRNVVKKSWKKSTIKLDLISLFMGQCKTVGKLGGVQISIES